MADAYGEQLRKSSEETGVSASILRNLHTRQDIQNANLGLTERQNVKLAQQVVLLNQAFDAEEKARVARQKQVLDDLRQVGTQNKADADALSKAKATIANPDRTTKEGDVAYLEALKQVDVITQRIAGNTKLARDLANEAVALLAASNLQKTGAASLPVVGPLLQNKFGLPNNPTPDPTPPAPAPAPTSPSGYPLGTPIAPQDALQAAPDLAPAVQPLATSVDGLKTALETALQPAATALDTAAGAVPGQVAPVVTGIGTLGTAYATAFATLAEEMSGQVGTLTDLIRTQNIQLSQTRRDIETLAREVYSSL